MVCKTATTEAIQRVLAKIRAVKAVQGAFILKGLKNTATLLPAAARAQPRRTACRIPSLINLLPAVIMQNQQLYMSRTGLVFAV
jgi:hypothetical protein